ncbi:MAG: sulfurtransferase TusA family protein [Limisphaerales bacterium]
MLSHSNRDEARTAESLIAALKSMTAARCSGCGAALCGHQLLLNIALGFKTQPQCLTCLSIAFTDQSAGLRDRLMDYVRQRECYRAAWEWTSRSEGTAMEGVPACLLAFGSPVRSRSAGMPADAEAAVTNVAAAESPTTVDGEWDAGDMGCGDLVLELRLRLQAMASGQVLKLSARDPGAREDLPAWCRMTGHALVRAVPPNYWIKRKE